VKLLTLARDLKRRKARDKHGLFVAEGVRAVEALADAALAGRGPRIRGLLLADGAEVEPRMSALVARLAAAGVHVATVSEREFAGAAETDTPQGVLALAEIPRHRPEDLPAARFVLVLDAVQDPGNAGTILRSAAAFGVGVTIALPGTVDVWNAKVVRSAMGALCSHPVLPMAWDAAARWLGERATPLWVADADGEPLGASVIARPDRLALAVANEGAGVSAPVAAAAARRVAIPMTPGVESLNVAVAAGILLYVLAPGDS
jgi:TrmH family RNA methyltransferase